jgi:hypothetical protein
MYVKLHDKADRLRFTVPCAAYVADNADGLPLLELVGADSENRAVWSHIVKARSERSLTATSAHFHAGASKDVICVVPTTKYHKVEQSGRVILLHEGLTRFRHQYLLGGDDNEPSPWFMLALQQHIPIPVLPHWAPVLWAKARELRSAVHTFAQALASLPIFTDLLASSHCALQMTGTLYNGMASSIYYLLWRALPEFRAAWGWSDVQGLPATCFDDGSRWWYNA